MGSTSVEADSTVCEGNAFSFVGGAFSSNISNVGMLVTLLMTVFGNALTVGLLLVSAEAFSHFAIYQEKVN